MVRDGRPPASRRHETSSKRVLSNPPLPWWAEIGPWRMPRRVSRSKGRGGGNQQNTPSQPPPSRGRGSFFSADRMTFQGRSSEGRALHSRASLDLNVPRDDAGRFGRPIGPRFNVASATARAAQTPRRGGHRAVRPQGCDQGLDRKRPVAAASVAPDEQAQALPLQVGERHGGLRGRLRAHLGYENIPLPGSKKGGPVARPTGPTREMPAFTHASRRPGLLSMRIKVRCSP